MAPLKCGIMNAWEICPFIVGADALIGPEGSVFRHFTTMEMIWDWLLLPFGLFLFVVGGPMRASAPTRKKKPALGRQRCLPG